MVCTEKYRTEDKLQIQRVHINTNTTQKKQTMQYTAKQNYPALVAFYDTRPANEVGLFYKASQAT